MHTDRKRFYAVLGIEPVAGDEAVRLAFRQRAKDLHPDAPTGDAEAFILLKRAYDTLSNPEQRAEYDRACQTATPPADTPHRWATPPRRSSRSARPVPASAARTSSRSGRRRRSGMGFMRNVIAFTIMAAVALGGVQVMISLTESPPSIKTRTTPLADARPTTSASPSSAAEAPAAPGSSKSGFWDPTPMLTPAMTKN